MPVVNRGVNLQKYGRTTLLGYHLNSLANFTSRASQLSRNHYSCASASMSANLSLQCERKGGNMRLGQGGGASPTRKCPPKKEQETSRVPCWAAAHTAVSAGSDLELRWRTGFRLSARENRTAVPLDTDLADIVSFASPYGSALDTQPTTTRRASASIRVAHILQLQSRPQSDQIPKASSIPTIQPSQ
jgi:hypothetical protein